MFFGVHRLDDQYISGFCYPKCHGLARNSQVALRLPYVFVPVPGKGHRNSWHLGLLRLFFPARLVVSNSVYLKASQA